MNIVAVKRIITKPGGEGYLIEFIREIQAFIRVAHGPLGLEHPNILRCFGGCVGKHLCLITEFCDGGNLFDFLHRSNFPLNWEKKMTLCLGVAKGIRYLHGLTPPLIHRDLKSLNFLLKKDTESGRVLVKISDFGTSTAADREYMTAGAGTYHWMAPEVIRGEQHYSTTADIYSFGVILWEISTR
jgi:serine/threonine protein kinase